MTDTKMVQDAIARECANVKRILVEKNIKYGNSAIDPVRIFSTCDPDEQLNVRIDDKLSRVARGQGKDDEDVSLDLIGYLILKRVYRLLKDGGYEFDREDQEEFFAQDGERNDEGREDDGEESGELTEEFRSVVRDSRLWGEYDPEFGKYDGPSYAEHAGTDRHVHRGD